MKKTVVLFLIAALLLGVLTGCQAEIKDPTDGSQTDSSGEPTDNSQSDLPGEPTDNSQTELPGGKETDDPEPERVRNDPMDMYENDLTDEELKRWTDIFYFYNGGFGNDLNCFFLTPWSNPGGINLRLLLWNFPGEDMTEKDLEVYAARIGTDVDTIVNEWNTPVRAIRADDLNEFLMKYVGVTWDQTYYDDWVNNVVYIAESDSFYVTTTHGAWLPGFKPIAGDYKDLDGDGVNDLLVLIGDNDHILNVDIRGEDFKLFSYMPYSGPNIDGSFTGSGCVSPFFPIII